MAVMVVGVDVSKNTLDVAYCTERIKPALLGSFRNEAASFGSLTEAVDQQARELGCDSVLLVAEPTGGYEQRLACFAYEYGWQVSLPNPRQVRQWAQGIGIRSKTDRQDALLLAQFGRERKPSLWTPMPKDVAALSDLLDRRHDIEHMLRQERNRQHALQGQGRYQGAVQNSIEQTLHRLEESLAEIERDIKGHIDRHPKLKSQAKLLRQVPGVGPKNVLPILVLCARWSSLTDHRGSYKGLTAYVGLDPQHYQSGRTVHKQPKISRQGNPTIRCQLFMGALGGIRSRRSVLRQFYDRLLSAGKPKMVALVAAARKILVWSWAVYRHQVPFAPALARARNL